MTSSGLGQTTKHPLFPVTLRNTHSKSAVATASAETTRSISICREGKLGQILISALGARLCHVEHGGSDVDGRAPVDALLNPEGRRALAARG